ncbi:MAG: 4Fe-4S dicluster domain-containing protein [Deltaproteobacteria bacterium]|nr:MAG: 4Fe-4S dicluster domain-containing protein [Deltaproteobacteria bacterium]
MGVDRRALLKVAGLTLLGLTAKPGWEVFSKVSSHEPSPAPGMTAAKRWAMAIHLERCWEAEGCRDCIDACHRIHNVPDLGTLKEEIKWVWTMPYEKVFPEHEFELTGEGHRTKPTPLLCNHCDDPPCTRYCPTRATWRQEDGIVMMDFHRCIGCRYCMAGCPYGSRSFNWRDPRPFIKKINLEFPTRTKGVVEKCNFCEERLAQGLLPACVEACKEKALVFGDLKQSGSEIRRVLQGKTVYQRQPELGTKPRVYYLL